MQCPNCHADNQSTQKFCSFCGTQLIQQPEPKVEDFNAQNFASQNVNDFFAPSTQQNVQQPYGYQQNNFQPQGQTYNPSQPINSPYSPTPQNPQIQYNQQQNGYSQPSYTPNNNGYNQSFAPVSNFNADLPMGFHTFYWVLCFVSAGLSLISMLLTMFSEDSSAFLSITTLLPIAYNVITGIFLMQRKKAGNIMRLISNIYGIVTSSLGIFGSFFIFILGAALATEYGVGGGLVVAVGIFCLLFCVASIVFNAIVMKYYSKRKHMFN